MNQNYIIFEQCYLKGRVLKNEDGSVHTIQIAGLDTNTMSIEIKDELMARMMYKVLEKHMLDSLKAFIDDLEDKLAEAQDQAEQQLEDEAYLRGLRYDKDA